MDGRPKRIKKFAFTSVCVYNRLRVDGALGTCQKLAGGGGGGNRGMVTTF